MQFHRISFLKGQGIQGFKLKRQTHLVFSQIIKIEMACNCYSYFYFCRPCRFCKCFADFLPDFLKMYDSKKPLWCKNPKLH